MRSIIMLIIFKGRILLRGSCSVIKRTVNGASHPNSPSQKCLFLQLSVEIQLKITASLESDSLLSLSNTCRYISLLLQHTIIDMFGRSPKMSGVDRMKPKKYGILPISLQRDPCRLERLQLLRILEIDAKEIRSMTVCKVCVNIHAKDLPPLETLDEYSGSSRDLGVIDRVWVFSHTVLSYDDIQPVTSFRRDFRLCDKCPIRVEKGYRRSCARFPIQDATDNHFHSAKNI